MANTIQIELEVDDQGSVVVKNFADKTKKQLDKTSDKISTLSQRAKAKFASMGSSALNLAKKIGKITLAAGALAAAFVLKKAISGFASFETALTDMGKVTSESMESIKTKIMALPSALGSATELVKGYYQVISAGVTNPKKAMETLKVASKAAKAAHVDQGEVIKGLTKVMAGFEGKIKDVSEAADLLFTIEKEGQTSFSELIPVIGGLAKISSDLGVHQNEMAGSLALITQTAGSTSEAATQYQAVLMGLMKPTDAMSEALKEMGYESAQAAIADQGLTDTLRRLKESTGGSAEKMNELFGRVEGVKGLSALAANEFENLNGKVEAMKNKTGAADKAWKNYKGTLSAIWDTFKNTVGKQVIIIGEKLAPLIKKVLEDLGKWLTLNQDMISQQIAEYVDKLAQGVKWCEENFEGLKGVMEGVVTVAKFVKDVFGWLGMHIGKTAAKIANFIEKVGNMKSVKWVLEFMGKASPVKPLSETIDDVDSRMQSLGARIGNMNPTLTIGISTAAAEAVMNDFNAQIMALEKEIYQDRMDIERLRTYAGPNRPTFERLAQAELREHLGQRNALVQTHGNVMGQMGISQPAAPVSQGGGGGNLYVEKVEINEAQVHDARQLKEQLDLLNLRYGES